MALQVFKGGKTFKNFLYQDLKAWETLGGEPPTAIEITKLDGSTVVYDTDDADTIARQMTETAMEVAKAKKAADKAEKAAAKERKAEAAAKAKEEEQMGLKMYDVKLGRETHHDFSI